MKEVPEHERLYVRNRMTGERGYLVEDRGTVYVRLASAHGQERRYERHEWIDDIKLKPLTRMNVAEAAFAAERIICKAKGLHQESKRDWAGLTTEQRIEYKLKGPKTADPERRLVWEGITKLLSESSE